MSFDESLFRAVNGLAGHASIIDQFFLIVGYRSTIYIPLAVAIIYWIWSNRREALLGGTFLGGVVGLADFLSGQLKWVVERVRPCRAVGSAGAGPARGRRGASAGRRRGVGVEAHFG